MIVGVLFVLVLFAVIIPIINALITVLVKYFILKNAYKERYADEPDNIKALNVSIKSLVFILLLSAFGMMVQLILLMEHPWLLPVILLFINTLSDIVYYGRDCSFFYLLGANILGVTSAFVLVFLLMQIMYITTRGIYFYGP